MEPVPLKIGENDKADAFLLKDLVENYSLYKSDYKDYRYYQSMCRNILIMLYLFIPAMVHEFLRSWEEVILVVFLVVLSFLWSSLNKASDFLVFKLLKKLSFERSQRVLMYKRYKDHLKSSIEEVLGRGTSSYLEDVVLSVQKKTSS